MSSRAPSVELLATLVSFDTTCRTSNAALIDFVATYLHGYGINSTRVPRGGAQSNLYATIGPAEVPGVLLAGHTDVVPAVKQNWRSDPFTLTERDGKLYARGAADMKGFIAAVLAAVPQLSSQRLRVPIHLAFTYDEEIGCVGVRSLLEAMRHMTTRPKWGIVGEPTSMRLAVAHKGKVAYRVTVTGLACHSRNPDAGVNAIYAATDLVAFIRKLALARRQDGPLDPAYEYPASSLQVGKIEGGNAVNIVPASCYFDFEIRHLPTDDVSGLIEQIKTYAATEIEPALRARNSRCGIAFEQLSAYPGLETPANSEPVREVASLLDTTQTDKLAFGSEAGLYGQVVGIPCVVCGPGSISDAHQPDEFVSCQQLALCDRFLAQLAGRLAA